MTNSSVALHECLLSIANFAGFSATAGSTFIDEVHDSVKVLFGKAARSEGRRAQPQTARIQRRLVSRYCQTRNTHLAVIRRRQSRQQLRHTMHDYQQEQLAYCSSDRLLAGTN